MSCQCFQVGGPFVAEDPDCPAHGWAQADRRDRAVRLQHFAQREDISVEELRAIVDQLVDLAVDW